MPRTLPPDQVDAVIFNGTTFRRYPFSNHLNHRRYYSPGGSDISRGIEVLHREVWKKHHGQIPDGYEIHHADDNPLNNDILNLECISTDAHRKEHAKLGTWSNSVKVKENLDRVRPLASDWHRSEEGRAWHRVEAIERWQKTEAKRYACSVCSVSFMSKKTNATRADGKRFCGGTCAAVVRRAEGRQLKSGTCVVCAQGFSSTRTGTKTCSRKCSAVLRWKQTGRSKE